MTAEGQFRSIFALQRLHQASFRIIIYIAMHLDYSQVLPKGSPGHIVTLHMAREKPLDFSRTNPVLPQSILVLLVRNCYHDCASN